MSPILIPLSVWLHVLATVIFIGFYLLLALIYLPILSKSENGPILSEISKRSQPWLYVSLLIFVVTGIILMFADPNYLGFGNFGNFWGIVIVVKHTLILVMVAAGFWYNARLRVGPRMGSGQETAQAISRFRQYVYVMAVSGVLVLLLTALAQAV